ncbi:class I SAM-dependent methyltransferase [Bradyrhizobium sp. G127]|uniref:class I SAM-dependent methyltransferase n=1 Tax=Bradyrhizobium sp. G127 TaxID=2904800 RepID=UPI001F32FB6B|nr:class I SAM-dependent methyltransferase [Bradyrhizobium sp. G127]MCF2524439.1 class I SAM-dependent methyltransferase [Bradyrhizobium sp. G127]
MQWIVDPATHEWRIAHGDNRSYGWSLCKHCGNGYPSFQPSPELLAFFWNRDRQDKLHANLLTDDVWDTRRAAARRNAERTFDVFTALHDRKPGRFLDIACGLGEAVKYFSDRGWDAQGVDVDPALKRHHDEIGIRSAIGPIETATIDGTFDIIHVSHAIYFITNPDALLKRLRQSLKPGGLLCVVISNFLANEDTSLPGYAHSFWPTGASLEYALALAGYKTVLNHRKSGSIYVAAREGEADLLYAYPSLTHLAYQTKTLRYTLIGRPKLLMHRVAKKILSIAGYC